MGEREREKEREKEVGREDFQNVQGHNDSGHSDMCPPIFWHSKSLKETTPQASSQHPFASCRFLRAKRRFLQPSESNIWHRESTSADEIWSVFDRESTSEDEIEKILTAVRKRRLAPREHL